MKKLFEKKENGIFKITKEGYKFGLYTGIDDFEKSDMTLNKIFIDALEESLKDERFTSLIEFKESISKLLKREAIKQFDATGEGSIETKLDKNEKIDINYLLNNKILINSVFRGTEDTGLDSQLINNFIAILLTNIIKIYNQTLEIKND